MSYSGLFRDLSLSNSLLIMPKKCSCGRTRNSNLLCDSSHNKIDAPILHPELVKTSRELASLSSGIKSEDRGNTKFFPTAGQAVEAKKYDSSLPLLPIIQLPVLSSEPTLKFWIQNKEGKCANPKHESIIRDLSILKSNGAKIIFHVDSNGIYSRIFSNANGNSITLDEIDDLLSLGYSIGEVCAISKLICGHSGTCHPKTGGECDVCKEYGQSKFSTPKISRSIDTSYKDDTSLASYSSSFREEINILIAGGKDYRLIKGRIINQENSKSVSLDEVYELCSDLDKGARYILEMLGVYHEREAASNNANKRADLGGR